MPDTTPATVAVAVAPGSSSKINWTALISGFAMLLSYLSGGQVGMTTDQQLALATTIGLITNIATFVLRTWFTKTVTPSSVDNAKTTTTLSVPVQHIT